MTEPERNNRLRLTIVGTTDRGLKRTSNQDRLAYNRRWGVVVLADGMGGHQSGEVAADMAVTFLIKSLRKVAKDAAKGLKNNGAPDGDRVRRSISDAVNHSNHQILQRSRQAVNLRGMGTTVVAAIAVGDRLYAGHVGDSRLYLYRDRQLSRMTKDHSMVQQWVDDGLYSEEEARTSGASHILTRALGVDATIEVDTLEHPLAAGDVLLLCSDGLSDRMPHSMIQEIMAEHLPAMPETMRALIDAANEMGGNDNIAVGLLRVERRSRRSIKGIVKRLSKKNPKDSTPS